MSSNQQNLTIGSIRLKSDYMVVKISLTTGLGSYPEYSVGVIPLQVKVVAQSYSLLLPTAARFFYSLRSPVAASPSPRSPQLLSL